MIIDADHVSSEQMGPRMMMVMMMMMLMMMMKMEMFIMLTIL